MIHTSEIITHILCARHMKGKLAFIDLIYLSSQFVVSLVFNIGTHYYRVFRKYCMRVLKKQFSQLNFL